MFESRFKLPHLVRAWAGEVTWFSNTSDAKPWTTFDLSDGDIDALVCDQLAPALRALLLAGYEADFLHVSDGADAEEWTLDVDTYETSIRWDGTHVFLEEVDEDGTVISDSNFLPYLPAGRPSLILEVRPLRTVDAVDLSVALPTSTDPSWALAGSDPLFIVFAGDPTAHRFSSSIAAGVAAFVEALLPSLVSVVEGGVVGPTENQGMLWLFSPVYWPIAETAVDSEDTSPLATMGPIADSAFRVLGDDPEGFLRGQISGKDNLRRVLRNGDEARAGAAARAFFRAAEDEIVVADLPAFPVRDLAHEGWLDAILVLATIGIISLEVLDELDDDPSEGSEPIQEVLSTDGTSISIYVHGQHEPVLIEHVHPYSYVTSTDDESVVTAFTFEQCVSWEYIDTADDGLPRLVVVAAPGIRITPPARAITTWGLQIYRVQDAALVPMRGTRIQTEILEGPIMIDRLRDDADDPAVIAHYLPNGVKLNFPGMPNTTGDTQTAIFVKVDPYSPDDRYAYDVVKLPDTLPDGTHAFAIVVAATANVKVSEFHLIGWNWEFEPSPLMVLGLGAGIDTFMYVYDYFVYRVGFDSVAMVPPGALIPIDRDALGAYLRAWTSFFTPAPPLDGATRSTPADGTLHTRLMSPSQSLITIGQTVTDIALGFIPVVGDALDIEEFLLAMATSRDKWGRPVAWYEKVLMGAGCMVPLVSSSWFRGLGRSFIGKAASVLGGTLPIEIMKPAKAIDVPESKILRLAERGVEEEFGGSLSLMARKWAEEAGILAEGAYLVPGDVMTTDGRNWVVPQLQYLLLKERALRNDPGLPIEEFLKSEDVWVKAVIDGLFGGPLPVKVTALARKTRQPSRRWWSLGHFIPKTTVLDAAGMAGRLNSTAAVESVVNRLVGVGADVATERVTKLLKLVAPGGDLAKLDDVALTALVGNSRYEVDDIVFLLLSSFEIMDAELARAKPLLQRVRPLEDYLEVPGVADFFKDVLTRGGYEHGTRFEMFTLAKLVDDIGDTQLIRYQHYIGSAKGPDFIVFENGLARIVQCKSYSGLDSLRRASGWVKDGKFKSTSPILKQFLRTLHRMAESPEGFTVLRDGAKVNLAPNTTFYVDSWWLDMNGATELDPEELHDLVEGLGSQINDALAREGLDFTVTVEIL